MSERTYDEVDQQSFAELSGDFNPLHVDPLQARRLMFGGAVVHGVHLLLCAIEVWLVRNPRRVVLVALRSAFSKPVRVGDKVGFVVDEKEPGKLRLQVVNQDETSVRVQLECKDDAVGDGHAQVGGEGYEPIAPDELSEFRGVVGALEPRVNDALLARLFPAVSRCLPRRQVGLLLASTRLVGMKCPGLHSVYAEINVRFGEVPSGDGLLSYQVSQVDDRFGLVTIAVDSGDMNGRVAAFVRPSPTRCQPYAEIRARVPRDRFLGQRSLVVGGSRGLGEVATKVLAAGGAQVMATWNRGAGEAQTLTAEIRAGGGEVDCARLDVLDASIEDRAKLRAFAPSHVYYFATPYISTGRRRGFDMKLFETFARFYVGAFVDIVEYLGLESLQGVFCPSSIFVESPPEALAEYAAAKAAAEVACRALSARSQGRLKVDSPRLPKMKTDQTASLTATEDEDPVPVMLEALSAFSGTTP